MNYDIPDREERREAKRRHDAWAEAVAKRDELADEGQVYSDEVIAGLREIDAKWQVERDAFLALQAYSPEYLAAQVAVDAAWAAYHELPRQVLGDATEFAAVCAKCHEPIWDDEEVLEGSDGTLVIRSLVLPDEPARIPDEEEVAA